MKESTAGFLGVSATLYQYHLCLTVRTIIWQSEGSTPASYLPLEHLHLQSRVHVETSILFPFVRMDASTQDAAKGWNLSGPITDL